MGKKRVRNTFGYSKPGQKKLTCKQATELAISEIEESYTRRLNREVNLKVADFIGDFCLALAWSLRANHGYGATRIERTIREMFQVGYFLFDMREIRQQLEVETGLDIEPVITDEVNKHINRAKEYKANYEKSS